MRVGIVGSEGMKGREGLYLLVDRFIYHHGSKNLTIVSESAGEVAGVVEKYCYTRGLNFINLPYRNTQDIPLFLSNIDRLLAFKNEEDGRLIPLLYKARKNGVSVMTITTSGEITSQE